MTVKELKNKAVYVGRDTYRKNGETLINDDLRYYFNADMEEIGHTCAITDHEEATIFSPTRKWARSFLDKCVITELESNKTMKCKHEDFKHSPDERCNICPEAGLLVWQELWAAMAKQPNEWQPTTGEMFYDQLGVVPPAAMLENAFLVGEAHHHNGEGFPVYAAFRQINNSYEAKYMTLKDFKKDA